MMLSSVTKLNFDRLPADIANQSTNLRDIKLYLPDYRRAV